MAVLARAKEAANDALAQAPGCSTQVLWSGLHLAYM